MLTLKDKKKPLYKFILMALTLSKAIKRFNNANKEPAFLSICKCRSPTRATKVKPEV